MSAPSVVRPTAHPTTAHPTRRTTRWRTVLKSTAPRHPSQPVPDLGPITAPLPVSQLWDGIDRRSMAAVDQLSRELDALCTQAVEAAEIAAGLEAIGWTDSQVTERLGLPDVFSLAEELFRKTPKRLPHRIGVQLNPWRERPLWHLARGIVLALPGVVFLAALPRIKAVNETVYLAAALALGWAFGQALSFIAFTVSYWGHPKLTNWWLRRGLLAGAALAGIVVAAASWWQVPLRTSVVGAGQVLYLAAAVALFVCDQELTVALSLIPGVLGAVATLVPDRSWHWIGPWCAVLSVTMIFSAALWITRDASAGKSKLRLARHVWAESLWHVGYGVTAALIVVMLTMTAPRSAVGQWALIPLIWSMGWAEWQLIGLRRKGFDIIARSHSMTVFRRDIRKAMTVAAAGFLGAVAAIGFLVLGFLWLTGHRTPGELAQGLWVQGAAWLLGIAFFGALVAISLQAVEAAVISYAIALVVGLLAQLVRHDLNPGWSTLVAPAVAAILLTFWVDRISTDPTRHA